MNAQNTSSQKTNGFLNEEQEALEKTFLEEAFVILENVETSLLSLEKDRDNLSTIKMIAREVHTLKGSSGCLDANTITKYVHKYEDIIASLQKQELEFTDDVYHILFLGLDRIKELVVSIPNKKLKSFDLKALLPELDLKNAQKKEDAPSSAKNASETKEAAKPPPAQQDSGKPILKDTLSVPVAMLDELSNFSGEITVLRNMINKIVRTVEIQYAGDKDIVNLGELLDEMHKINAIIQTRIVDLRKVPLSSTLKNVPRMLHDLCHNLGKKIDLEVKGDQLRVDNSLAMVCSNSLVHLVRNSVDHGVESPQDRRKAGKQEAGKVSIKCSEEHEEVHIKIKDDGRGIDASKIKGKALEKGLFTEAELDRMSESQILSIIFSSGFSTAAAITDVSGRGVGMDMVKASVESVGGVIDIETKLGQGTTFTLRLPIPKSVLIINSLLVEAAGRSFAIPQDSILRIILISPEEARKNITQISSGFILNWNNKIYPLLDLKKALKLETTSPNKYDRDLEIIIVQSDTLLYALLVDAILDSEEIVVKTIQPYFNAQGIYTGATFMGDGSIGLILDIKGVAGMCGVKSSYGFGESHFDNPTQLLTTAKEKESYQNILLFHLDSKALYGVPLEQVFRLEEITEQDIQHAGAQEVCLYRDDLMPLHSLQSLLNMPKNNAKNSHKDTMSILVTQGKQGVVGLKVLEVVDILESKGKLSRNIRDRVGISGSTFIRDQTITILDLPTLVEKASEHLLPPETP
jgi:two-component system chemotaxis sensor kinase CheA